MLNTPSTHVASFHKFGRRGTLTTKHVQTNNVVIYTRVSSKEQADKNMSLEYQMEQIEDAVKRESLNVEGIFGGTYESAKTDGRKEFQRMLSFIKERNKRTTGRISKILVWRMDRFSRSGASAMKLVEDLREKYGVSVYAVTQPMATDNPTGILQQNILLSFSEYDNQMRKQAIVNGMRKKLDKGYWIVRPPQGYDILRSNGERKIVLNETGKKIRKAFRWKLEGMSGEEIVQRLRAMGVKMYRQQLCKILSNPFYCGIISHGLLDGKVVRGNHEKMISEEVFMQINDMRSKNTRFGVKHIRENEDVPLRVFTKCDHCGQPMTGYKHKQKGIFYYKCRTNGCKSSKNANQFHKLFGDLLDQFAVNPEVAPMVIDRFKEYYHELNADRVSDERTMKLRLAELEKKVHSTQESYFVEKEMPREVYDRLMKKYVDEKSEIEKELVRQGRQISNLDSILENIVIASQNLSKIWHLSDKEGKDTLQETLFPGGIRYNKEKEAFLTSRVLRVLSAMSYLTGDVDKEKKGLAPFLEALSLSAERAGNEPNSPICSNSIIYENVFV